MKATLLDSTFIMNLADEDQEKGFTAFLVYVSGSSFPPQSYDNV